MNLSGASGGRAPANLAARLAAALIWALLWTSGAAAQDASAYEVLNQPGGDASQSGSADPLDAPGGYGALVGGATAQTQPHHADGQTGEFYNSFTPDAYARAAKSANMVGHAQSRIDEARASVQRMTALAMDIPAEITRLLAARSLTGNPWFFLFVLFKSLLFLGVGYLFARYIYGPRIVGPRFRRMIKPNPQGFSEKLPVLAVRALAGVVGAILMIIIALTLGYIIYGPTGSEDIRKTIGVTYGAFFFINAALLVWRMILSPYLPQYRIPGMSDAEAYGLFQWLRIGAVLAFGGVAFCLWIEELGLSTDHAQVLTVMIGMATVAFNVLMIVVNAPAISHAMRGGVDMNESTWVARVASQIWAPFAIVYLVVGWGVGAARVAAGDSPGVPPIVGAYLVLAAILVVYALISYSIERFFIRERRMQDLRAAAAEAESAEEIQALEAQMSAARPAGRCMETFEDLARRVASGLALVAGFRALLWLWGLDAPLGQTSYAPMIRDVGVILGLGYIVYHATRIWIERRIQEEGGAEFNVDPGDEGGKGGVSRLATLLPLFKNFLLSTISIVVALLVMLELGVNVAPLFAGAGVVGLAIGFGAQTLIRDIFSGVFFLIDDAFRRGEYIDIGSVKGTVEKISVRSFQLRHHLGYLHTVPFGEVQFLTNFSRDWVIMKLPLRLTYDTDAERVRKLIKKLGKDLLADPLIGHKFVQQLKSQGVVQMEDSAMIIRIKFMTKPGDQWELRKRIYNDIRELFERENIKFAHRQVTVYVAGENGAAPTPAQKAAAGASAAPLIEEMAEGPQGPMDDR